MAKGSGGPCEGGGCGVWVRQEESEFIRSPKMKAGEEPPKLRAESGQGQEG